MMRSFESIHLERDVFDRILAFTFRVEKFLRPRGKHLLCQEKSDEFGWAHLDSNQEPKCYEHSALPLSYGPKVCLYFSVSDSD